MGGEETAMGGRPAPGRGRQCWVKDGLGGEERNEEKGESKEASRIERENGEKKENETNQISLFIIPIKNPNPIAEP